MASFNKIILVGNLTRDPELTYTPSNTAVCKFGIATNHKWKDQNGNQKEDVCFVDCTLFGKGGEIFKQYMAKGRPALVEGRLQLQQWTSKEGEKKSRHAVIVDNFQFLGGREGAGGRDGGDGGPSYADDGGGSGYGRGRTQDRGGADRGGAGADRGGGYSQGGYQGDYNTPPPQEEDIPF